MPQVYRQKYIVTFITINYLYLFELLIGGKGRRREVANLYLKIEYISKGMLIDYKYYSMDIASQVRKAFETLVSKQQFTSHILEYTRSALQSIYNLPQTEELDTPPSFIILLSHIINTNQSINPFISTLPKDTQTNINKLINKYASTQGVRIDNTYFNNLCDVQWEMFIENGRQIWQVKLFTFENKAPLTLRLNYEQLSILTFQVSQIVNQINQIQKR